MDGDGDGYSDSDYVSSFSELENEPADTPEPTETEIDDVVTDDSGEPPPATEPAQTAAEKYKIRRGGEEREYTLEELQRMASDDHEEELTVDGQTVRVKMPDILRGYRIERAAMGRLEQATNLRKQLEAERQAGREDPLAYLRQHLGVNDTDEWLFQRTKQVIDLRKLRESDPEAYADAMDKRRREAFEREQARQKAEAEARKAQEEDERWTRSMREAIPGAAKRVGLPETNAYLHRVASAVLRARNSGLELDPADAAAIVQREVAGETVDLLSGMDGDAILAMLGKDLRKKIREAEIKAIRGAKTHPVRQTPTSQARRRERERDDDDGGYITGAEFMRS